MTRQQQNISTQLTALDRQDSVGREQYERNLRALFDRKLSPADWARLVLMGVGGLAGTIVCGLLAATEPGMPTRTRVALAVLALIGLSWTALAGVVFRRGSIHSAVHGTAAATMGFAFALLATAGIGMMSLSSNAARSAGPGLILLPITALALGTVVLIVHHLKQSELRLRRDLLGIEYRLARLAESGTTRADSENERKG